LGKLKFGVFLPFYAFKTRQPSEQFSQLKTIVLDCEQLGYDSVWLDDHLMYGNWPILESWTTLSALASATSRIRLGTMVCCMAHRNPALLAKEAATLDVISGGRLELGLGAGAQEMEHTSFGFGFPKLKGRVGRLGESLEVIGQLWSQNKVEYNGKYFSLQGAVCEPKPIQKPHPPIIVGGTGRRLMQQVTAKFADRFDWGYVPSIEEYKQRLATLEADCRAVGRDFGEIEKSCWPAGQLLLGADQKELAAKITRYKPENISLEDFKKTTFAGTAAQCLELLGAFKKLGVNYFMLYFADLPNAQSLRFFAREVISRLN
jgi:alkanesulfonate monooxygenase SsuD/methylene tetrahydromethanopterin reductase-like flavin-dependent oxidoreductase (luciferase family)